MKKNPSPLFLFAAFFVALAGSLLVAALLSPLAQGALSSFRQFPLHRVFNRITMICVLGTSYALLRHYRLADRSLLGYGIRRPVFLLRLAGGFTAGMLLMAVAILPLFLLGLRVAKPELGDMIPALLGLLPKAVLTGLTVALIEETFFRGAMQGAMSRDGSSTAALCAVPALYAAVHFFGEAVRVPFNQVQWDSGFTILAGYFAAFTQPLRILDAFLALYLVGLLLALVRRRAGDIAGCIGLHAGFVAVIAVMRKTSVAGADQTWSFLVGPFDGLLGIWIAFVTGLACLAVLMFRQNGFSTTK